ncbi:NAD(P)-dependent dehydrogenase (short-subunit alcohol dehydrogenase family) [Arthrobacter ginsengisoli]|uniref:NAD(P)-dependent dehydrogenase (Short-subunit alcohol dehydrogenase family) n=1 Tax=Arthrobacter ginsengisoli TaxID=1356565 RepID=A0ABU1UBY9_9MICC|nr:short-chain dehydrogenase/reductase [Arthrobacter ginsengisoli]MDR7082696.1 NAD(P)-dependent dehydrogenase (short-subunit alcohol dehydrogenase family) [Arthrobacter ginsengisoli]
MDLRLQGKTVLITGASQGIGRETALVLAEEGCNLILVSRDGQRLNDLAGTIRSRHGVSVGVVAADLSSAAGVERVSSSVGDIDVLVNNAGAIPPGTIQDIEDRQWKDAWDLKVFGYIGLVRSLYANLKARQGVIVNIIGAGGETFRPDYIAGATGNAALMAFTRALGKSAALDRMRIVGINPGPVSTPRNEMLLRARATAELGDENRWMELNAALPCGRSATPAEIASAVAFLASPRSGYTNGTILTIDGAPAS